MAAARSRILRQLIVILVVVGGMWSYILIRGLEPHLGLDLQGGVSVVLEPAERESVDGGSLEQAVNIIRNRVDALGVAEPDISRQGDNVLVQIPGIDDQERALELIGTTAKLRFRPIVGFVAPDEEGEGIPICGLPDSYPEDIPEAEVVYCIEGEAGVPAEQWQRARLGPAALEGTDVARASAVLDPTGQQGWTVNLDLTGDGARKFADITGDLACARDQGGIDQLAIVLDKVVESNPGVNPDIRCDVGISGGTAVITGGLGGFPEREAKDLALVLRYGALPVELIPSTTTEVSPTLGRESLRGGLLAGLIGVAVVYLYMLAFYRRLGPVVWLGLAIHAAFTFGVVIILGDIAGFALSLAGIAGLIVSLGIASDSFIVYFERIKDEMNAGKTARAAVDRAWVSARRTIIAADLVTALAAAVLYLLAVGSVRGFALMLGLATFLDLFVSFWFMHPVVWLLGNTKVLARGTGVGIDTSLGEAGAS